MFELIKISLKKKKRKSTRVFIVASVYCWNKKKFKTI